MLRPNLPPLPPPPRGQPPLPPGRPPTGSGPQSNDRKTQPTDDPIMSWKPLLPLLHFVLDDLPTSTKAPELEDSNTRALLMSHSTDFQITIPYVLSS